MVCKVPFSSTDHTEVANRNYNRILSSGHPRPGEETSGGITEVDHSQELGLQ